jgi:di/tricarboxylate transporter
MREYVKNTYGLQVDIFEVKVPEGNILIGHSLADLMDAHHIYIIGTDYRGKRVVAPLATTQIEAPCRLAILGLRRVVEEFAVDFGLELLPKLQNFSDEFAATHAGVAELVIPPGSPVIGKTPGEIRYRATHGLSLLGIHRSTETLSHVETPEHSATRLTDIPLFAGDTLIVHTTWESLTRLSNNRDYVIVTSEYPREEVRPQKVGWALAFFSIAIVMILTTDIRLSLCLLTGAVGMVVTRVLSVDEAYGSVGWNTVFLLASLIPLGIAVQATGTAGWIAQQILSLLDGWPVWGLQIGVAIMATIFTLIMSNVGATVLLVPLAVSIAVAAGANPAVFALTVAISTSNSFLIPTHQVNALIMGPGGYRVTDFVRCGSIMTVLFLIVSMFVMNLIF